MVQDKNYATHYKSAYLFEISIINYVNHSSFIALGSIFKKGVVEWP